MRPLQHNRAEDRELDECNVIFAPEASNDDRIPKIPAMTSLLHQQSKTDCDFCALCNRIIYFINVKELISLQRFLKRMLAHPHN